MVGGAKSLLGNKVACSPPVFVIVVISSDETQVTSLRKKQHQRARKSSRDVKHQFPPIGNASIAGRDGERELRGMF